MPISGITVGSNIQTVVTEGDPTVASQYKAVIPVADATNITGKFGALNLSATGLKNAGGNLDVARAAPGAIGVQSVSPEGTKNTYSSASPSFSLAATATDFYTIIGSASKTVRILRITITGIANAGASPDIYLIKRSTADTGGASTAPTIVPNDSNNAAATAVVTLYSANPGALGVAVGIIRVRKLNLGVAGAAGIIEWKFSDTNDQAVVLRGVAENLALNFNGAAVPAGTSLTVDIEFVEDSS